MEYISVVSIISTSNPCFSSSATYPTQHPQLGDLKTVILFPSIAALFLSFDGTVP
jgi:hypothetical protein|tara:strand:+ start:86 stop:250 length:165 start_codon:yes stop_codon:yes gene_type:complete